MKISNFNQLAQSDLRKIALSIAEAGLSAIDTEEAIRRSVFLNGDKLDVKGIEIPIADFHRIFVVAIGKCAIAAATAIKEIFKDRLSGGFAYDIKPGLIPGIDVMVGDHPFTSEKNAENSQKLLGFLGSLTENDLVIFAISGGGSALLSNPEDIGTEKEKDIVKKLFKEGADIKELNTIRKHISSARGGNLARAAYPAKSVSLIFSDVPGDNIEFVASGPTVKDTTTVEDAERVFQKYKIRSDCGILEGGLMETPKDEKYFQNVLNLLVVSNNVALEAMAYEAKKFGYEARIVTDVLDGEARIAGEDIAGALHEERPRQVLLYGGETVVVVKGKGKGGRNQELALAALSFIKDGELILSLASDGRDNIDVAGAICDIISKRRAEELRFDSIVFLENNDSYGFFRETGDHVLTGPTGSNVADLVIAIKQ